MPGDDFSGYYLRINKGIELEILHQDTIVDYKLLLDRPFNYQNVLDCNDDSNSKKPNTISVGEEDAILCLVPDDMRKHGFIVAEDGDQLVLFQYLDPDDIAPVIDSDIYEDLCIEHGIYIHEVGRTADIDVMKRALYAMAYRYTKNDLYIFPVSLYAATETFDLKKAGRKAHKWTGKELTEEEKKSLERTKKRVRRYASKFNLI